MSPCVVFAWKLGAVSSVSHISCNSCNTTYQLIPILTVAAQQEAPVHDGTVGWQGAGSSGSAVLRSVVLGKLHVERTKTFCKL